MDLFDARGASPMLIARQCEAFDSTDYIYELKMDGFRCLAYLEPGMADLRNKRNIKMLEKFPELTKLHQAVRRRCILDGEIVVLTNGVPDFYRLQKRTLLTDRFKIQMEASRFPASFVAFDSIYLDGQDLCWEPLIKRKERLSENLKESDRIAVSRYIEGKGMALYQAAEERELEGVVAKRKDSLYYPGKRTKDWVKFKRMTDEEFIAAGYIRKGLHTYSLIIAKYREDVLVYKGHVTSGVTKETVQFLTVTKKCPLSAVPAGNEHAVWVKPDQVCRIEYMPNTKGALRQPVFRGFRDDILPRKVQMENF